MNDRIKALRLALGLSQKDFGEQIGLSVTGLSSIERGQNPVQERHVKLILAAFPQVSAEWIREGTGSMFVPSDPIASCNLPSIAQRFVRAYERLPQDQKDAVDRYLDRVINDIQNDDTESIIERKLAAYESALRAELEAQKGAV